MQFSQFKSAVAKQFAAMAKHQLFRVDVDKDRLWQTYLDAYPEGTNPIYRTRREYDCSCCRQFVRSVGNVVAITPGLEVHTIWDGALSPSVHPAFAQVAQRVSALVRSSAISDYFLSDSTVAGTDRNFEQLMDGSSKAWEHFFVHIPKTYVQPAVHIPKMLGEMRTAAQTFGRALATLTPDAVATVIELIDQNSLYRGAEFRYMVAEFQKAQAAFKSVPKSLATNWIWLTAASTPSTVTGIRNTAIGTLLVDLSEGRDLESAVGAYETVVAPTNYRRPTALVTKQMIDNAKAQIEALGLTSALERRFAKLDDISINNVLFADRSARAKLVNGDDVFSTLKTEVAAKPALSKIEEVPIDKFLSDILPKAQVVEVLVERRHVSNFVSLIAPTDPTAQPLFKWGNPFSWSYSGEVADAIKERVKAAGGSVTGELCCRLAWDNTDDLDLWMREPNGDSVNYISALRYESSNGGMLDLDANGRDGLRKDPAENIVYDKIHKMKEGQYILSVHQYRKRGSGREGFQAQIEFGGQTFNFQVDRAVRQGERIEIATLEYRRASGLKIVKSLGEAAGVVGSGPEVWGVPTNTFRRVNAVMLSPNFWTAEQQGPSEVGIGNKHFFFMLDGCANDGTARGFYNEFLRPELNVHRKVMEMVGSKLKPQPASEQLSGLGFSSTARNTLVARVKGSFTRDLKIVF